jgi:putative DNA primase/helicase
MLNLTSRWATRNGSHATLQQLLHALEARRSGTGWSARCPAHHDRRPSLSIGTTEDRVLVHCFVCSQADVMRVLKTRGLWPISLAETVSRDHSRRAWPKDLERIPRPTTGFGLGLWREAQRLYDPVSWPSCLSRYFESRGLQRFEPCGRMRFHPRMPHGNGRYFPAMLVLATDVADVPRAIQATYLQADGSGKVNASPCRKTFGSAAGCAVRLLEGDDVLIVAEGVETALSAAQATGEGAYALLGTGGLKSVELPEVYRGRRIAIAADNDASGTGWIAAQEAAQRLLERGFVDVRLALPPDPGSDYNDLLRRSA